MWKSYHKRLMFNIKRFDGIHRRIRIDNGAFMFRISMDNRREPWLNDRKKFYSHISLRKINQYRKRRGWTMTSVQVNRKRFEDIVYWGGY